MTHLHPATAVEQPGRLPDFLIIGAMKAGTTSLYQYLKCHPQVFMPHTKELDFFARELNWERGFSWYRRQFLPAGSEVLAVGEASTSYTMYPTYRDVPQRIATHLPEVRLIYVVRHPIERSRSHYRHNVATGRETRPIDEALLKDPCYLDYSRYAFQIERYLQHFDRERLLVISSDELRDQRLRTIRKVFQFLGVDVGFVPSTLEQEFYRSDERVRYPRVVGKVRSLAKRWAPTLELSSLDPAARRVRAMIGRNTRPSGPASGAEISEGVGHRLEELLREDVERLGGYVDGFGSWGLVPGRA